MWCYFNKNPNLTSRATSAGFSYLQASIKAAVVFLSLPPLLTNTPPVRPFTTETSFSSLSVLYRKQGLQQCPGAQNLLWIWAHTSLWSRQSTVFVYSRSAWLCLLALSLCVPPVHPWSVSLCPDVSWRLCHVAKLEWRQWVSPFPHLTTCVHISHESRCCLLQASMVAAL